MQTFVKLLAVAVLSKCGLFTGHKTNQISYKIRGKRRIGPSGEYSPSSSNWPL